MKHAINAVLVDDEPGNLITLQGLLERYCPEVNILAAMSNPLEAIEQIRKGKPNLVFLDIEMPYANGFDVLDRLAPIQFQVIFVTAFSDYAIKAFRYAALDYLLKPLNIDDLMRAVDRVKKVLHVKPENNIRVEGLLNNLKRPADDPDTITCATSNGFELVKIPDIIYFQADGSYSNLMLKGGKKITLSKGLKEMEELLSALQFFRVHYSYLINLSHIKRYHRGRGGHVEMTNGTLIEVATRRKSEFLEKLKGLR